MIIHKFPIFKMLLFLFEMGGESKCVSFRSKPQQMTRLNIQTYVDFHSPPGRVRDGLSKQCSKLNHKISVQTKLMN